MRRKRSSLKGWVAGWCPYSHEMMTANQGCHSGLEPESSSHSLRGTILPQKYLDSCFRRNDGLSPSRE